MSSFQRVSTQGSSEFEDAPPEASTTPVKPLVLKLGGVRLNHAVLVLIVPKIGAASDLAVKIPNPQTYEMYQSSVNHTVVIFRDRLHKLRNTGDDVKLANIDLDTGDHVKRGEYPLTDATYARLLERLASTPDRVIPADTKRNILTYYGTIDITNKPNPSETNNCQRFE